MRLGPASLSGRVVEEMASETTFFNQKTTRHRHSINHSVLVLIFQGEEPFCFSEIRGDAKIKMFKHFQFGRPWSNCNYLKMPKSLLKTLSAHKLWGALQTMKTRTFHATEFIPLDGSRFDQLILAFQSSNGKILTNKTRQQMVCINKNMERETEPQRGEHPVAQRA